jgi:hypothetical protein
MHGFHMPTLLPPAPLVSNPNLYHLNPNSSFPHCFILRSFWLSGRLPWPSLLASPPHGQAFGFRHWSLAYIFSSIGRAVEFKPMTYLLLALFRFVRVFRNHHFSPGAGMLYVSGICFYFSNSYVTGLVKVRVAKLAELQSI